MFLVLIIYPNAGIQYGDGYNMAGFEKNIPVFLSKDRFVLYGPANGQLKIYGDFVRRDFEHGIAFIRG